MIDLEKEVLVLQDQLVSESYRPGVHRQFWIREPKLRQICCAPFRDRVVHHAVCDVMEPLFENTLIDNTYACRSGKGMHAAIRQAQRLSRSYKYYLKCDVRKYFESVDHEVLKKLLRSLTDDLPLLRLLDVIVDQPVKGFLPGKGLPIGNLTSQYFANLYLGELDQFVTQRLKMADHIRYMDDFVLFHHSKNDLWNALSQIENFLNDVLLLKLKPSATQLAPCTEGLPFLGFRIFPNLIRLKRSNVIGLRRKIKVVEHSCLSNQISQNTLVNSVQSMVAHISHANTYQMRHNLFS